MVYDNTRFARFEFLEWGQDDFPAISTWPNICMKNMMTKHKDYKQRMNLFTFLVGNGLPPDKAIYWILWGSHYDASARMQMEQLKKNYANYPYGYWDLVAQDYCNTDGSFNKYSKRVRSNPQQVTSSKRKVAPAVAYMDFSTPYSYVVPKPLTKKQKAEKQQEAFWASRAENLHYYNTLLKEDPGLREVIEDLLQEKQQKKGYWNTRRFNISEDDDMVADIDDEPNRADYYVDEEPMEDLDEFREVYPNVYDNQLALYEPMDEVRQKFYRGAAEVDPFAVDLTQDDLLDLPVNKKFVVDLPLEDVRPLVFESNAMPVSVIKPAKKRKALRAFYDDDVDAIRAQHPNVLMIEDGPMVKPKKKVKSKLRKLGVGDANLLLDERIYAGEEHGMRQIDDGQIYVYDADAPNNARLAYPAELLQIMDADVVGGERISEDDMYQIWDQAHVDASDYANRLAITDRVVELD